MIREPDLFISTGQSDAEIVQYLNKLFHRAANDGANDIHLLWNETRLEVKFRLSGDLELIDEMRGPGVKMVDEKIRARANMSAAERNIPLDGRIRLRYPDRTIDVRLSLLPVIGGQKIVCRILDQTNAAKPLSSIEMTPMVRRAMQELIEEPQGLLLVVGPTGSGKTTTLYALIGELNNGRRNIITLEHPVEYVVPGISQVNIDQHLSFADGLRAALRQDPDIILVGEIRDEETAKIAVQAANTGHLVLATLHANSAPMAVTRMLDFGLDPHSLAASLRGVMAQRLVRRITASSKVEWKEPTEAESLWLASHNMQSVSSIYPVVASPSEFHGMVPVIEMLRSDPAIRASILQQAGELPILNAAARQYQFETLAQAATRLAATGYTTLEQARKIVGDDALAPQVKRLGEALIDSGLLTFEQVFEVLQHQIELRKRGIVRKLGELLVDKQLISANELVHAIGCTSGAPAVLEPYVRSGRLAKADLDDATARWHNAPLGTSLYTMLLQEGLLTEEEIHEPSLIFSPGSHLHLVGQLAGAGHAADQPAAEPAEAL